MDIATLDLKSLGGLIALCESEIWELNLLGNDPRASRLKKSWADLLSKLVMNLETEKRIARLEREAGR